jgi:hypothetical protein
MGHESAANRLASAGPLLFCQIVDLLRKDFEKYYCMDIGDR